MDSSKKPLTELQTNFLSVLFEEAGGDLREAKRLAGYSEHTRVSDITKSLRDEIIDRTKEYLINNTPKAAFSMVGVLDGTVVLGVREKVAVAKDIMDRAGLLKSENVNLNSTGGVMILPPKREIEEGEDEF